MGAVATNFHQSARHAPAGVSAGIALFPGSFKPPHSAHLHAVRHLLDQEDVAEVVIIISNRCRLIPETGYAIDAEAARAIFRKLLCCAGLPLDRIRIEIAKHRAIVHALEYFDRVSTAQSLVFCVGKADCASGDDRFAQVDQLSGRTGIAARIEVLPRAPNDVHATKLRRLIAAGPVSRDSFLATLPGELSRIQKMAIWSECRNAVRPVSAIVKPKIRNVLSDRYGISLEDLHEIPGHPVDPVFLFRDRSGHNLLAKYAGDTTVAGTFGEAMLPKPAQRLAVERRALRHLATHLERNYSRPAVDFFDKRNRVSVLTRPPDMATRVSAELSAGRFDMGTATAAARLLARLHQCPAPQEAFWGSATADREHWKKLIVSLASRPDQQRHNLHRIDLLQGLRGQCEPASGSCMLHLNFVPANVWQHAGRVGIEDFERVSSYGDPAYDVATFVAQYIYSAALQGSTASCVDAVDAFIATYLRERSSACPTLSASFLTYITCHLLALPASTGRHGPARDPVFHAVAMLEWIDLQSAATLPSSATDGLRRLLETIAAQ